VELLTLVAPAGIEVDENGHVSGVRVTPQMISTIKDGRASVIASGEPEYVIPCQTMIVAIGQNIETKHYEESGIPVSRGKIFQTADLQIFLVYLQVVTVLPVLLLLSKL
jgi:NADPH-dependent glutamate synthase beta subunit-like oxidoreductase